MGDILTIGKNHEGRGPLHISRLNRSWGLITLLFATGTISYVCRVNVSIVGALMMRDLNFSQIDMGRVFSAFLLGYAIFQIPGGAAADRWGARRVLIVSTFSWFFFTICIAGLGSLNSAGMSISALAILILIRFFLGIGEASTFPSAAQAIAEFVPKSGQGLANGVVLASIGAGSALTPFVLSRTMVRWGWEFALVMSAITALGVCCGWAILRDTKSKPRTSQAPSEGKHCSLWSRSFIFLTISYAIEGYVSYVLIFWFYLYLVNVRHFDLIKSGNLSSLPGALSIISIPLGGFISDRLIVGRLGTTWGRRVVPIVGLSSSGLLLALGAETKSANMAVFYLTLATGVVLSVEGPFWATMMEIAGDNTGTGGGAMNCGSNIGGLISPTLTPILAAHIGWASALQVAALLAILGAILWLGISVPKGCSGNAIRE